MSSLKRPSGQPPNEGGVLSSKKQNSKPSGTRSSQAAKYFDDKSQNLPEPVSYLPFAAEGQPEATRPPKPISQDFSAYGPDDPLFKIEESTSKITALVSDYERQQQESNLRMMAELDSDFQVSALEPREILQQSKTIVDGLMNRNRELKESQNTRLGALQSWMRNEEQTLSGQSEFTSVAGASTEDLIAVLSSSEGLTQEKITKAVALHSDIVTKAFLAIHEYQKRLAEQEKLIKELEGKIAPGSPQMKYRRMPMETSELQKQLEKAHAKIKQQEDVIRSLNGRIEQLISEALLGNGGGDADAMAEENLQKARDILALETKLDRMQGQLDDAADDNFKLKMKARQNEDDADFYRTQMQSLKERADLEKSKREALSRDYIAKLSDQDGDVTANQLKESMERVMELEKENDQLRRMLRENEEQQRRSCQNQIARLKKEFEGRELEIKKRQITTAMVEGGNQALVKALEAQHEEEMNFLRKEYDEKIAAMQRNNAELMKKSLAEKDNKIKELQLLLEKGLENLGDEGVKKVLDKLRSDYEEKLRTSQEEMVAKMEKMSADFLAMQHKLTEENKAKDSELRNLLFLPGQGGAASGSPLLSAPPTLEKEEDMALDDMMVPLAAPKVDDPEVQQQLNEVVEQYQKQTEEKVREHRKAVEKKWADKYQRDTEALKEQIVARLKEADEVEKGLREKIDELNSQNQVLEMANDKEDLKAEIRKLEEERDKAISEKRKLAVENDVLQQSAIKGNGDTALTDLASAFAQQSEDLEQMKQKMEKLQQENKDLREVAPAAALEALTAATGAGKKKPRRKPRQAAAEDEEVEEESDEDTPDQVKKVRVPRKNRAPRARPDDDVGSEEESYEYVPGDAAEGESSQAESISADGDQSVCPRIGKKSIRAAAAKKESQFGDSSATSTKRSGYSGVSRSRASSAEPDDDEPGEFEELCSGRSAKTDSRKRRLADQAYYGSDSLLSAEPGKTYTPSSGSARGRQRKRSVVCSMFRPLELTVPPERTIELPPGADTSGGFVKVSALSVNNAVPLFLAPARRARSETGCECADVACQVATGRMNQAHLRPQPPIEIFGVLHDVVTPEEPVILHPSPDQPDFEIQRRTPKSLITRDGQLIEIPHLKQIDENTHPLAVQAVTKTVVDDAIKRANDLRMIVSELEAIENETDPEKKAKLQETLGISLDVEKDSLVSEMKERITELEQLVQQTSRDDDTALGMEIGTQTQFSAVRAPGFSASVHSEAPLEDVQKIASGEQATSDDVGLVRVPSPEFVRIPAAVRISPAASKGSISVSEVQTGGASRTEAVILPAETAGAKGEYVEQGIQMSSRSQRSQALSTHGGSDVPPTPTGGQDHVANAAVVDAQSSAPAPVPDVVEKPKVIERGRVKMNAAPIKRLPHRFYSVEIIEIVPTLKSQLNAIQRGETPRQTKEAIENVSQDLQSISSSIAKKMEPVIQLCDTRTETDSHELVSSNIQLAVGKSDGFTKRVVDKHASQLAIQGEVVKNLTESAMSFLQHMDTPGGADPTQQSEFLRDVNQATATLQSTVTELSEGMEDVELLKKALHEVRAEYEKQSDLVQGLKQEILDLKTYKDMPQIGTRLIQIRDDIQHLLNGEEDQAKVITSLDQAKQVLPGILQGCLSDALINRIGGKSAIQQAVRDLPNWEAVVTNIDGVVEKLRKDTVGRRNEKLIRNLNEQNSLMTSELQKLRTKTVINDRDVQSTKRAAETNVHQMKSALDRAQGQIAMLERQLRASGNKGPDLAAAQALERERYQELCDEKRRAEELVRENQTLRDKIHDLQDRFNDMFATATDTQTSNQILQNRTNEMLMRAQLDADKARALERIQSDTAADLEAATKRVTRFIDETAELQNKISQLELEMEDLRRENLDLSVYKALKGPDARKELPKLIRLYQDRAALYQDQLGRKTRDLMDLKTKRACDQKALVMLNRELRRVREQLRLALIKYESAKGQLSVADKALAGRDETIRELRREIERLRSLLKMNAPIQRKLKEMQKDQNETYEDIKKTHEEIEKVERAKKRFASSSAMSNYFDEMLRRNRDRLAKLEVRRRAIKDQERLNEIENLRAMSQIVRESELTIPESLVIQLMPKPEPVKNLTKRPIVDSPGSSSSSRQYIPEWQSPSYKTTSYADNLQIVGSLVGKKSPRTLQKMLRNARHGQVVVPETTLRSSTKRRSPEKSSGLNMLTIKSLHSQT